MLGLLLCASCALFMITVQSESTYDLHVCRREDARMKWQFADEFFVDSDMLVSRLGLARRNVTPCCGALVNRNYAGDSLESTTNNQCSGEPFTVVITTGASFFLWCSVQGVVYNSEKMTWLTDPWAMASDPTDPWAMASDLSLVRHGRDLLDLSIYENGGESCFSVRLTSITSTTSNTSVPTTNVTATVQSDEERNGEPENASGSENSEQADEKRTVEPENAEQADEKRIAMPENATEQADEEHGMAPKNAIQQADEECTAELENAEQANEKRIKQCQACVALGHQLKEETSVSFWTVCLLLMLCGLPSCMLFYRSSQLKAVSRELRLLAAKNQFLASMCGAYPDLVFEVVSVREINPLALLEAAQTRWLASLPGECSAPERSQRVVFHTCSAENIPLIANNGLRPSQCMVCRGLEIWRDHDCGWFGDHTKGVYVSKHADYTFYYQQDREPQPGDYGEVILLHAVTGKIRHFAERSDGVAPTPGFQCHESPNHLEFYLWDEATVQDPPRNSYRAIPKFVIRWRAIQNQRMGIQHDQ